MILNAAEYEKAHSDVRILEQRIADLDRVHPIGEKGFTKAGVRKMIAKINEELEDELMRIARENDVLLCTETEFGVRYVIDGRVLSPEAARAEIRTV